MRSIVVLLALIAATVRAGDTPGAVSLRILEERIIQLESTIDARDARIAELEDLNRRAKEYIAHMKGGSTTTVYDPQNLRIFDCLFVKGHTVNFGIENLGGSTVSVRVWVGSAGGAPDRVGPLIKSRIVRGEHYAADVVLGPGESAANVRLRGREGATLWVAPTQPRESPHSPPRGTKSGASDTR